MTARAITAAAMREAVAAAKAGCRVELRKDGTLIIDPPALRRTVGTGWRWRPGRVVQGVRQCPVSATSRTSRDSGAG